MESENSLFDNERKGTTQRSAAYPAITIEKAIDFVTQLKKAFHSSSFTRVDITEILKKTGINREVGAAVQYGLLDRTIGEGYKLSARVKIVLDPISDDEYLSSVIECFNSPKLYVELIERFKGAALPPLNQFINILSRFHNITKDAAPKAAEIFIQNASYAGLLNENKVLLANASEELEVRPTESKAVQEDSTTSVINERPNNIVNNTPMQPIAEPQQNPLLLEEINGSVNIKIRLSDRKIAHLIYPENITDRDIQILKLQLEALALTL